MKKIISFFLVISMIMCNLNTGVVEALSSYGKGVKSLVNKLSNIEKDKIVDQKEDKKLEKEMGLSKQNSENEVENTKVVELDKKSYTSESGNVQENIIFVYNISTGKFYYEGKEIDFINERITTSTINLNDVLRYSSLDKSYNVLDGQEVTLKIIGTGRDRTLEFDNNQYPYIPVNIEFDNIDGTNCYFTFENVKAIHIKGNNTITNLDSYRPGLTYSFNMDYSDYLNIADNSSFIVYNNDETSIDNNIVCYNDSGDTSVVNISFEDDVDEVKKLVLDPVSSKVSTQKNLSTKVGCKVLSMLLAGDNEEYVLKEENKAMPYYYRTSNSNTGATIKTKFTLTKGGNGKYYKVNNKPKVEVIVNKKSKQYYLANTLKEAMETYVNTKGYTHEVILLGNYSITTDDIEALKNYDKNTNGITFKTKVDDWTYTLDIDGNIELMVNNVNQFPITFSDIKFNYISDNRWIHSNGRPLIFGQNIRMDGYYPSVSLVKSTSQDLNSVYDSSYLSISSGTYNFVVGDCYSKLQDIDVTINGGTFKKEVSIVGNNLINVDGINNATLTINEGTFESTVYGVGPRGKVNGDLEVTINGGSFRKEVIVTDGEVGSNATVIIDGGTFANKLYGSGTSSNINKYLNISINEGTFRKEVIVVSGKVGSSAMLTISGGTFRGEVIGISRVSIEKVTLNALNNRYLFSNNTRISNNQAYGTSSELTKVNINVNTSVTIPSIREFTKLVVGETGRVTLSVSEKLDKGSSIGDLCLKNGSRVLFKTGTKTTKLNNIELYGNNNTLVLPVDISGNTTKEKVLIELSGEIIPKGNKLKIDFGNSNNINISGVYLIKFEEKSNSDITNKYILPTGYYVRDNQEDGYVILYPQTTFDLKYNFNDNKLYMIDKNNPNIEETAWWYTGENDSVILDTDGLYKYKGYDLFKNVQNVDRNLILAGSGSNKTIVINSKLSNLNVTLDEINLSDSKIVLNKLKTLTLSGKNIINNINVNQDVFTYNFNNNAGDKVLFDNGDSYLTIFTNKDTNPFNGYEGSRIDLKFQKTFDEELSEVTLKNVNTEYKFQIPKHTQRLALLLKDKGNYNLYHGSSSYTGSSVYVSGNTSDTFNSSFETSLDKVYDYVRRAKPVNKIDVTMPSKVDFGVSVRDNKLDSITEDNWKNHFYATEIKVENNSLVAQDQFTDDSGEVHYFGTSNTDIDLGYMGVSSSEDTRSGIKLISNDKLASNIIEDNISGVNLSLKLLDESDENISIDEEELSTTPLKIWSLASQSNKILRIVPDFGNKKHFFNISRKARPEFKLNSSHRFIFRYGLKSS